jgi:hypothetical protein
MKTFGEGESRDVDPPFLTSALDGDDWSSTCPGGSLPRSTLDRRLDGPRIWSGRYGEEKILPLQKSNPGHPTRSPSLYRLSYPDPIYV